MPAYQQSDESDQATYGLNMAYNEALFLNQANMEQQTNATFDYNLLDMPPEMYDAFLQIEPISVTMNPGFDLF